MDPTPSALETLLTNVGTVITNIMNSLSTVATSLMSNAIFQLVMGVVFFGIILGVVYSLVRKVKKHGK